MAGETRLTIVQYSGDFYEAATRLAADGPETYRAQRYTVSHVESLVEALDSVVTITAFTETRYDKMLPNGARAIGAGYTDRIRFRDLQDLVESTDPDLLVLRSPLLPLMHWAVSRRCRTLLLLADSFNERGLKAVLKRRLLAFYMNRRSIDQVSNHGVSAARQLAELGVQPGKVVPWDYPPSSSPTEFETKSRASSALSVVYVGMLLPAKGVGDLVNAVALLRARGLRVMLDLVGGGTGGSEVQAEIDRHALSDQVFLVGQLPNHDVIPAMRRADIVVVPSRFEYPEGMPLTIYEALCARTPLVVSNHPMFLRCLRHRESALIFEAGNAVDLADQIERLSADDDLYRRLSENAPTAWRSLQLPVTWGDLIDAWIRDKSDDREWLLRHSLRLYDYDKPARDW